MLCDKSRIPRVCHLLQTACATTVFLVSGEGPDDGKKKVSKEDKHGEFGLPLLFL